MDAREHHAMMQNAASSSARAAKSSLAEEAEVDRLLSTVEKQILGYHGEQLERWGHEQRIALERDAELDDAVLAYQSTLSERCIETISKDMEAHRAGRDEQHMICSESLDQCEEAFCEELVSMGEGFSADASDVVSKAAAKVRANTDAWENSEWGSLENALRTLMWQHAKLHHGFGVVEGVAELWEKGELQPFLDDERDGWARSQRGDIEELHKAIDAEYQSIFQTLEERLKDLSPESVLADGGKNAKLAEMAEQEKKRLQQIENDVREQYRSEIDSSLLQVEEDYRHYDTELQRVLVRTLEARMNNAELMRKYKSALCRWRLDYQKVYHTHAELMAEGSQDSIAPSPLALRSRNEVARLRLQNYRKAVQSIWSTQKTPRDEIQKLVSKLCDAASRAGGAEPLVKCYEQELRQYGALPLVEHAKNPELLQCWFDALDGMDPAGKR